MTLRIRQLEIRIKTLRGKFGIRLPFPTRGLAVIRANNTSGKSTCVQALIYGLGLESMLTANQQTPPLQYAVLKEFVYKDEKIPIAESEVFVELENAKGEIVTVQRSIVHPIRGANLVTVWNGPLLTNTEMQLNRRDYFVRIEGAAQRADGFHHFFANYLDWKLPTVSRFDGGESPLYLECIFPLFFVEQKHGWSGIQSRMPTHFRIREMGKRAIEYVLRLDSYAIATEREKLRDQIAVLTRNWERVVRDLDAHVGARGGVLKGFPPTPISEWPPVPPPDCLVFDGEDWNGFAEAKAQSTRRLRELAAIAVPTISDDAKRITEQLNSTQREMTALELAANKAEYDTEVEQTQLASVRERISALQADLQNYKDLRRLREIGSELKLKVVVGRCPTCEQEVNDVLLDQTHSSAPMTFDENIKFISGQIEAFSVMRSDSERVVEARERSLVGFRNRLQELRTSIRAYRQALTSAEQTPSVGAVRERMVLEANVQAYQKLEELMERALEDLEGMAKAFKYHVARLEELKGETSKLDDQKLSGLQDSFISQLTQYGFSSLSPDQLRISRESFRPTYDGFDLGFNLSASDMIRTIWSYLYGLMEVARTFETNHLGLLILDEPRQQQADRVSFTEFTARASAAAKFGQQVIFLTSEDPQTLKTMLEGVEHSSSNFDGKMIMPLEF